MSGPVDLRALPSVDQMLNAAAVSPLVEQHGRAVVTDELRKVLGEVRLAVRSGGALPGKDGIVAALLSRLDDRSRSNLRPLFNLTGTVLHTNLGRALLAQEAVDAAVDAMREAAALEFDLDSGGRGERDSHLRELL